MTSQKSFLKTIYSFVLHSLIPRPWDLFVKGLHFWYGFLFGFFILNNGIYVAPTFLNRPFIANNSYLITIPTWCKLFFWGLLFFIIEEVVLQQAKLLWDDLYDIERDKKLPLNSKRAISSGYISVKSAKINILLRLIFSFSLGYLLGGSIIIILFSLILFHQGLYMFWGKPVIQKHPLLVLSILSLSTLFRFITGVIIISNNVPWVTPITFLTLSVIYLETFSALTFFWRVEADYLINAGKPNIIRPQSQYFLKNGKTIQHISIIIVDLIILYASLEGVGFDNFPLARSFQVFASLPLIILLLLLTYALFFSFKKILPSINRMLSIMTSYFFFVAILLLILSLMLSRSIMSLYGFFLYNLARVLAYENMDFLDYTFASVKMRIYFFFAKLRLN